MAYIEDRDTGKILLEDSSRNIEMFFIEMETITVHVEDGRSIIIDRHGNFTASLYDKVLKSGTLPC